MPWKQTGLARTTGDQGQMTSLIEHNTLSDLDCILHSINTMDIERLIAVVYQESPLWDKRNKLHANPWSLTNAGKPLVDIWKLKVSFIVNLKIRQKKKKIAVFPVTRPTLDFFS